MSARLRISMLGVFTAEADGTPMRRPKRRDAERLWIYLLVHRAEQHERSRIASTLWPDDEKPRPKLRQALHALQKHLPEAEDDLPWVVSDGEMVGWNRASDCELDVEVLEDTWKAIEGGQERIDLERLEAVASGDAVLLDGMDEAWIMPLRPETEAQWIDVNETLARKLASSGWPADGVDVAERMVTHDPLREESHRLLISLLLEAGDRAGALTACERYEDVQKTELGSVPDEEMIELIAAARGESRDAGIGTGSASEASNAVEGHVSDDGLGGALRGSAEAIAPAEVPHDGTEYVGSWRIDELVQRLETARLLTITGPPGAGKSRVVAEAARRMKANGSVEVWYFDLYDLESGDQLLDHVGAAYGLRAQERAAPVPRTGAKIESEADHDVHAEVWRGQDLVDESVARLGGAVANSVDGRPALVVMDNADRVIERCADLALTLLRVAPDVTVCVTSRERLDVKEETAWRVPLLSIGSDKHAHGTDEGQEAVDFLLGRSRNVLHGPALTPERSERVNRLASLLGGVPLALEYAAMVAEQTGQAPEAEGPDAVESLLGVEGPVGISRHATLAQTVRWSVDELLDGAYRMLVRIGSFDGDFTLAEAVHEGAPGADGLASAGAALDDLDQLVRLSLVERTLAGDGPPRFHLLPIVRAVARGDRGSPRQYLR